MNKVQGKKVKMGQVFREENVVPVTFVKLLDKEADFAVGDKLRVIGKSKGRGFQGVVKRHGFAGAASQSHGTKHTGRAPGSIGATGPQRVMPGVRMAGRMGQETVNLKSVIVVSYEKERGLLLVKGALPGMNGSKVTLINRTVRKEEDKGEAEIKEE
ncbi:MAG: 50S ribosomal protein L3 [Candidatus Colwellbacteria bacterium]